MLSEWGGSWIGLSFSWLQLSQIFHCFENKCHLESPLCNRETGSTEILCSVMSDINEVEADTGINMRIKKKNVCAMYMSANISSVIKRIVTNISTFRCRKLNCQSHSHSQIVQLLIFCQCSVPEQEMVCSLCSEAETRTVRGIWAWWNEIRICGRRPIITGYHIINCTHNLSLNFKCFDA